MDNTYKLTEPLNEIIEQYKIMLLTEEGIL